MEKTKTKQNNGVKRKIIGYSIYFTFLIAMLFVFLAQIGVFGGNQQQQSDFNNQQQEQTSEVQENDVQTENLKSVEITNSTKIEEKTTTSSPEDNAASTTTPSNNETIINSDNQTSTGKVIKQAEYIRIVYEEPMPQLMPYVRP